jgi:signal transduction histidine kinase
MFEILQPHFFWHSVGAVIAMCVFVVGLWNRDRLGAIPLAVMMGIATLWMVAEVLALQAGTLSGKLLFSRLQLMVAPFAVLSWLWFALEYTGNHGWITGRNAALLAVEPLAFAGLLVTIDPHPLIRSGATVVSFDAVQVLEYTTGPIFALHQLYLLAVWGTGAGILIRMVVTTDRLHRAQGYAIILAGTAPVVANLLWIFDVSPPGVESSIGFVATGLILAIAIFYQQLLDYAPVARNIAKDKLIEELDDRVFVLDNANRIVDLNPAAEVLFEDDTSALVGVKIDDVLPELAEALEADNSGAGNVFCLEIDGVDHHFDVTISSIRQARGVVSGHLVSLRDITNQRRREQRLDVLTRVLRHNLRNKMSSVIGNAQYIEAEAEDEAIVEASASILEESWQLNNLSEQARQVVTILDQSIDQRMGQDLAAIIAATVEDLKAEYPEVRFESEILDEGTVLAIESLQTAIEQVLENACKHNDDQSPWVAVTVDGHEMADTSWVRVIVQDNGPGIPKPDVKALEKGYETALEHGSGLGLWLVKWIVELSGGEVAFPSTEDGGIVELYLPRAVSAVPEETERASQGS